MKKTKELIKKTRTENFVKNTTIGIVMQFFSLILSFVSRTIFIKILTNNYLSINGLFSNILSTLSVVELGFGTALIYFMYKPVATDDKEQINKILKYYKKVYTIIGLTMIAIGLMVIPFMKYIIKEPPAIKENLNYIYILFLLNTVIGYFFSHKVAIINAYQKTYINSIYNQIFKWIQLVLQVAIIILTKNYILYLLIQLICTLFNYLLISFKANSLFPFIKDRNVGELSKKEKKEISKKVKSLIFYRMNPAILNGSDNIILSSFVGLKYVGIYSNYYLIISYISMFISQITSSLEIGIGNLNALETKEKKEKTFYNSFYLCFFIHGIVCALLMALTNDFIRIWLGEEYVFSNFILFSIILILFINGMQFTCYSFRTTAGLFEKNRFVPLYEVIINLLVSIILAKYLGVVGVFLGTSIARLSTLFWTDPQLLYNELFDKNNKKYYYIRYLKYTIIAAFSGALSFFLSTKFAVNSFFMWIIKAVFLSIFVIGIFIILTYKSDEFRVFYENIKKIFKKIIKKGK